MGAPLGGFFGGLLSGLGDEMLEKKKRQDQIEQLKIKGLGDYINRIYADPTRRSDPALLSDLKDAYMESLEALQPKRTGMFGRSKGPQHDFQTVRAKVDKIYQSIYPSGRATPGFQAQGIMSGGTPATGGQMNVGQPTAATQAAAPQYNIPGLPGGRGPLYTDPEVQGMEREKLGEASQRKIMEQREASQNRIREAQELGRMGLKGGAPRSITVSGDDPQLQAWAQTNGMPVQPGAPYRVGVGPNGEIHYAMMAPEAGRISQQARDRVAFYKSQGEGPQDAYQHALRDVIGQYDDLAQQRWVQAEISRNIGEAFGITPPTTPRPAPGTQPGPQPGVQPGAPAPQGGPQQPPGAVAAPSPAPTPTPAPAAAPTAPAEAPATAAATARPTRAAIPHNNPTNIKMDGKTITDFPTTEAGWQAAYTDLKAKMGGQSKQGVNGATTIAQLGNVWAPPGVDRNVPGAWAKNVASALGKPESTPIGQFYSEEGVKRFAAAVYFAEHGNRMSLSDLPRDNPGHAPEGTYQNPIPPPPPQDAKAIGFFLDNVLGVRAPGAGMMGVRGANAVVFEKGRQAFHQWSGMSPEELNTAITMRKVDLDSMKFLRNRQNSIGQLQQTLAYHGKVWEQAVKDAGSIGGLMTRMRQALGTFTYSDPMVRRVLISAAAVRREYGRLISGAPLSNAQPAISNMEEARAILPTFTDFEATVASVGQLGIEAAWENKAYQDYEVGLIKGLNMPIQQYMQQFKANAPEPPLSPPSATPEPKQQQEPGPQNPTKEQYDALPNGGAYYENGVLYHKRQARVVR